MTFFQSRLSNASMSFREWKCCENCRLTLFWGKNSHARTVGKAASVTPRPIFSQRDLKEAVPSERLHYGEDDDKRGQYARHLIQHPQFLVAERPKPLCQLFRIANHPSMITGENNHKKKIGRAHV